MAELHAIETSLVNILFDSELSSNILYDLPMAYDFTNSL